VLLSARILFGVFKVVDLSVSEYAWRVLRLCRGWWMVARTHATLIYWFGAGN